MNLLRHLSFGARYLRRNPAFSLGGVAILSLGIGLATALFAIVQGALIAPWPYRGYDRIVTVRANYPLQRRTDFPLWSPLEIADLAQSGVFETVIAGDARDTNLTYEGRAERVRAAVITPNVFAMDR